MIIDSFTFFNEFELLFYRIKLLEDFVDYFIIVESNFTYSGNLKELYLKNFIDKSDFSNETKNKIIIIIADDLYDKEKLNNNNLDAWYNENKQRNHINDGLILLKKTSKISNKDYIIISDLDEIVNPEIIKDIKNKKILYNYFYLNQDFYYYNLKCKCIFNWNRVGIIKYGFYIKYKITPQKIRDNSLQIKQYVDNGGWHLSYFMDTNKIIEKIKNFSHQEFNNPTYLNYEKIQNNINNYKDIYDINNNFIKIPINENNKLPPYYEKYLTKFI